MNNELINLVDLKNKLEFLSGYEFEIRNGFWDDVSYLECIQGKTVIKIKIDEYSNRIIVEYQSGISISKENAEQTVNLIKQILEEK